MLLSFLDLDLCMISFFRDLAMSWFSSDSFVILLGKDTHKLGTIRSLAPDYCFFKDILVESLISNVSLSDPHICCFSSRGRAQVWRFFQHSSWSSHEISPDCNAGFLASLSLASSSSGRSSSTQVDRCADQRQTSCHLQGDPTCCQRGHQVGGYGLDDHGACCTYLGGSVDSVTGGPGGGNPCLLLDGWKWQSPANPLQARRGWLWRGASLFSFAIIFLFLNRFLPRQVWMLWKYSTLKRCD